MKRMIGNPMELFDLTGQVAIVTGSSQGIGRACAERLAEHGSKVVFSSRTLADCEARANAVNDRFGEERAIAVRADMTDRSQLKNLVDTTLNKWARIDTMVGNALVGADPSPWIEHFNEDSFTGWFEGNVTNNAYLTKLVSPQMRTQGGGSVVFISSVSGVAAQEDYLGYGTSKAALNHLARVLALQLGPSNVRVNAVAPGIVASRGVENWGSEEDQRIGITCPLGRLGTPDEIAGCVVWLASPGGTFVTGSTLVVDGGLTLKGADGPHDLRVFRREQKNATRAGRGDA
jgi:NAD(P)-dependent dehydrogenase (short-subunit alcohol dehydrogenase family)